MNKATCLKMALGKALEALVCFWNFLALRLDQWGEEGEPPGLESQHPHREPAVASACQQVPLLPFLSRSLVPSLYSGLLFELTLH